MHDAHNDIVLPVRVLLARAFNVDLEFPDGFIEGSIIIKTLDLKNVL